MADLLPATFAALGAVLGLIVGATLANIAGSVAFGPDFDLVYIVLGGLAGAVVVAWLGLRVSGRVLERDAKPS